MELNIPVDKRTVYDYEFLLSSGIAVPVSVDPAQGDSIEYLKGLVYIHISAKSHPSDPTKKTSPEDHTINLRHVAATTKREREVLDLNPEQKEALKQAFIQKPSTTIM